DHTASPGPDSPSLPDALPICCARVLGIRLDSEEVGAVFARLGFAYERQGDDFIVTPPAARFDLMIEEDLIEEVARIHGFDRIPKSEEHTSELQSRENLVCRLL